MSELTRWIEASQECQSLDQLHQVLEDALMEAADDRVTYQGLLDLSDYFRKRGYREWQIWLLHQLFTLTHKKKVAYYLAKAYFELTDYATAYDWLAQAKTDQPVFLVNWLEAQLLFALEQGPACQKVLQGLIQTYPTRYEPYELLAQCKIEEGDYAKARDYYQLLLEYFPDKVDRAAIRQRLLALALEEEVMQLDQIEALTQWADLPMDQAQDFYLLALAYQRAGQLAQAVEAARTAVALDSEDVESRRLLAELYAAQGQTAALEETLDWLFQVTPADDERLADYLSLAQEIDYLTPAIQDKLLDFYLLQESEDVAYQLVTYLVDWVATHQGAGQALDLLDDLAPDFPDPDYLSRLYAPLYAQAGLTAQARAAYQEALNLLTVDAAFLAQARDYFASLGDLDQVAQIDRLVQQLDTEAADLEEEADR